MSTPASRAATLLAPMTVVPMPPVQFQKKYKQLWKDFERALREDFGRGVNRVLHKTIYSFSHERGYDSFEKVEAEYIANIDVALLGADDFESYSIKRLPEVLRALNERHAATA